MMQKSSQLNVSNENKDGCRLPSFQLSCLFTDNCVLQREKPIAIFGTGAEGTGITAVLCKESRVLSSCSGVVAKGQFTVYLPPLPAGGPYTLIVKGGSEEVTLTNVFLGDIWLAGGQSNMEFELNKADHAKGFIAEVGHSDYADSLFFYRMPHLGFEDDHSDAIRRASKWQRCTAETVGDWSAVGFFFARRIQPELGVPIGIIDCNWGGTSASAWMDRETLASDCDTNQYLLDYEKATGGRTMEEYLAELADYNVYAEAWEEKKQECYRANPEIDWEEVLELCGPCRWPGPMGPRNEYRPCGLYETMLKKCVPYTLKGFLYYQGESDEHHPEIYYKLFRNLISVWRRDWQDDTLPFLFVQLPMFQNRNDAPSTTWATLRAAQAKVFDTVKNTGMAVLLDLGKFNDIHPTEKHPVGERLALVALYQVYGILSNPQEATGPKLRHCVPVSTASGTKMKCWFDYASDGFLIGSRAINYQETKPLVDALSCPTACIQGFAISGRDGVWYPATAEAFQEGTDYGFYLSAKEVPEPVHARYAWINWAPVTVFGKNQLPLAPFEK